MQTAFSLNALCQSCTVIWGSQLWLTSSLKSCSSFLTAAAAAARRPLRSMAFMAEGLHGAKGPSA